jgi:hypothetical protein
LPDACVVTGAPGVPFRRIRVTRGYPWAIVLGLLFGGPIGAVLVAFLARHRADVVLPLSDEGLAIHERLRLIWLASIVAAIVLIAAGAVGPMTGRVSSIPFLPRAVSEALGYAFFTGATFLPLGVWFVFVRGKGPELVEAFPDNQTFVVRVPF